MDANPTDVNDFTEDSSWVHVQNSVLARKLPLYLKTCLCLKSQSLKGKSALLLFLNTKEGYRTLLLVLC